MSNFSYLLEDKYYYLSNEEVADPTTKVWNQEQYDNFIQNGDYSSAVDMRRKYRPKDPAKAQAWDIATDELESIDADQKEMITKLEFAGEAKEAYLYGSYKDNKDWVNQNVLDEYDADGNLLRRGNRYAKSVYNAKKMIGGTLYGTVFEIKAGSIDNPGNVSATGDVWEGTVLGRGKYEHGELEKEKYRGGTDWVEFEFNPIKRTFWGADWLDWVRKDGKYSFDDFTQTTGITADDIRQSNQGGDFTESQNFGVYEKNGKTYVRVHKDNPYFNDLAEYHYNNAGNLLTSGVNVYGVVKGKDKNGRDTESLRKTDNTVIQYVRELKEADAAYERVFNDERNYDKNFTQLVLSDSLIDMYNYGDDLNKRNREQALLEQIITSIGFGNYEITSNAFTELDSQDMKVVSPDNKQALANFVSRQYKDGNISMVTGGYDTQDYGTYITIGAIYSQSQASKGITIDDKPLQHQTHIFIKGLNAEQVKQIMDNDTKVQAMKEFNHMKRFKRGHKFDDGRHIYMDNSGNFVDKDNNRYYTDDEIQRELIKESTIKYVRRKAYDFMNADGVFMSKEAENKYSQKARMAAELTVDNDLYPNIVVRDINHNPMSMDTIWNLMNPAGYLDKDLAKMLHPNSARKIEDMFEIYRKIMENLF